MLSHLNDGRQENLTRDNAVAEIHVNDGEKEREIRIADYRVGFFLFVFERRIDIINGRYFWRTTTFTYRI